MFDTVGFFVASFTGRTTELFGSKIGDTSETKETDMPVIERDDFGLTYRWISARFWRGALFMSSK